MVGPRPRGSHEPGDLTVEAYLGTPASEAEVTSAVALGAPLDVPDLAAAETLEVLVGLASRANLAGPLLLAATGREPLPAGFSVL